MNTEGSTRVSWASFYDFYDGPEHRQSQIQMYRRLAGEAGGSVLELACGTGIITLELARAGFEVTGGDKFIPSFLKEFATRVSSVSLRQPSLDDVFLKLTGREIRQETVNDEFKAIIRQHGRRLKR